MFLVLVCVCVFAFAPAAEPGGRLSLPPHALAAAAAPTHQTKHTNSLDRAGVSFQGLRVTYDRLTVTRRARAAGAGLPSLVSPLRDMLPDGMIGGGGFRGAAGATAAASPSSATTLPPATVNALRDVSGVLRPATSTLLLGAPGAGKTTLLRALSGRLREAGAIVHVGLRKEEHELQQQRRQEQRRSSGGGGSNGGGNGNGNGSGNGSTARPSSTSNALSRAISGALEAAAAAALQPPHYWLRYNGVPAAPPSTGSAGGEALLAAALTCCGGCAGAPPPPAPSRPSPRTPPFEVPAVAAYVDQAELCAPALTVRETLDFAERCQGADAPSLAAVRRMLLWEKRHSALVEADGGGQAIDPALDALLRAVAGVGEEEEGSEEEEEAEVQAAGDGAGGGAKGGGRGGNHNRPPPHQPLITEWTLRSLRLEHAADTPVGDAMLRGVSGGEKRRVALGEALVGPAFFFALDEVTTGLDSASALEVALSLRRSARAFRVTVLCALLQPEPDVVGAFDDLVLLARGRVLFHGPVGRALPHFAALGLCPALGQDAAEFLVGLAADDDQEAERLSKLFWEGSEMGRVMMVEVQAGAGVGNEAAGGGDLEEAGGRGGLVALPPQTTTRPPRLSLLAALPKKPHASPSQVLRACFSRTYTLEVRRNLPAFVVRALLAALMACVLGLLFFRLPPTPTGGASTLGILVALLDFFAVLSIPTAQTTLLAMPLLLRQRDARYYPAWMILLPQQVVSMAALLMDVACFALPLYFFVGLTLAIAPLLRYLVVCYCFALCLDALYRAFGALATSVPVAISGMTVLFLLFNALAGLTIARRSIPPWWRWLYWTNPFAWGLRSLAVNELTQPRWQQRPAQLGEGAAAAATIGGGLLALYDMPESPGWVWAGAAVLAGEALVFLGLVWWGYARRTPPVPPVDVAVAPAAAAAAAVKPLASASAAARLPPVVSVFGGKGGATAGAASGDDGGDGDESDLALPPMSVAFRDLCYFVPHPNPAAAKAAAAKAAEAALTGAAAAAAAEAAATAPAPTSSSPSSHHPARPELQLLRSVTGHFTPGRVAALMGASGAGKTTLLDVLAMRKTTGRVTGDLACDGRDPRRHGRGGAQPFFRAVSGYCEQSSDLHVGLATVREAVLFSAELRLRRRQDGGTASASSSRPRERRAQDVSAAANAALAVVGLSSQSGVLVQALSLEQKKRLTIAVELAARPSVLFLDEPTSGLDASGAWAVGRALRAVASRGGTVVCTVHQPGDALFRYAFDDLLLLRRGGAVAYFGPLGQECALLARYFQGVEARISSSSSSSVVMVAAAEESGGGAAAAGAAAAAAAAPPLITPLANGQNPAAWVIGVVGADRGNGGAGGYPDLARAWRESAEAREARRRCGELLLVGGQEEQQRGGGGGGAAADAAATPAPSTQAFAVSPLSQFGALLARNTRAHWRHPARNLSRVVYAAVAALLIGTIFFGRGSLSRAAAASAASSAPISSSSPTISSAPISVSTRDVLNAAGCYFLVVVAVCMESAYAAQEGIALERPSYARELSAGAFSPLPYLLAQVLAELPWCLLSSFLFVGVSYGLLGCLPTAAAFFYFVAVCFFGVAAVYSVAQLLVFLSPALFLATIAMSVAATAQQALAGLYRTKPSASAWFAWAYWLNPLWFTFAGLVGTQLGGETRLVVGDAASILAAAAEGGSDASLDAALPPPPTVAEFVAEYFGVDARAGAGGLTSPGACLGMLAALGAGATALSYVALRTLNWQSR
jgi:ABC-type multidrug transport system ATPase subunit/ABC-type multidrug transport system permease subunit